MQCNCTFASTRPATPLLASAPGWVLFFYMHYNKPSLDITGQIKLLESRGLVFRDKENAAHYLSNISYYRMRAYTYPYQNNADPNHPFVPHPKTKQTVSFEDIINDYNFDRKLKLIVFDAIEKVEIALRTQMIYQYALEFGGYWFEDATHFQKPTLHANDLTQIDKQLKRSREAFIKHYKDKYQSPARPPAWMTLEVLDFGTLSKMFRNLQRSDSKKGISAHFGIDLRILENWFHNFSVARNICAHHSRLWNRDMTGIPTNPKNVKYNWVRPDFEINKSKIYFTLCALKYILNIISPGNDFKSKIKELLTAYPNISLRAMAFDPNWEHSPVWMHDTAVLHKRK